MTRFARWSWVWVFGAAMAIASPAQTFKTLASFRLIEDGGYPQYMSLVQGTDGNVYGTAPEGGVAGQGSVFQVTTGGDLTFLCNFGESDCPGGGHPFAGL